MKFFCTYFDINYLSRAVVLCNSLRRVCRDAMLFGLCFDDESFQALTRLELNSFLPISLEEFESEDDALRSIKAERSRVEYYFTCTPSLPRFLFRKFPEIDFLTYLDADLCFFADPSPVFDELSSASVGIIEH